MFYNTKSLRLLIDLPLSTFNRESRSQIKEFEFPTLYINPWSYRTDSYKEQECGLNQGTFADGLTQEDRATYIKNMSNNIWFDAKIIHKSWMIQITSETWIVKYLIFEVSFILNFFLSSKLWLSFLFVQRKLKCTTYIRDKHFQSYVHL